MRHPIARSTGSLLLLWLLALAAPSAAEDPGPAATGTAPASAPVLEAPYSGDLAQLSDAQIDARIAFLTDRFDDGEDYATYWQYAFTGAWSLGVVIGGLQAGLLDGDDRYSGIVTAVKAAFGVTRLLLQPQPGMQGSRPITELPGATREERMAQLEAGEKHLAVVAKRADERYRWLPHLGNLATNLAGMAVLFGVADTRHALESAGVGIFMGEVMIWTSPWRGADDVEEYESAFDAGLPKDPEVTWSLIPTPGGGAIQVRF